MFKKTCACGKANKNFKHDIGPFYVDDCCRAAGYDELGKRTSSGNSMDQLAAVLQVTPPGQAPTILQVPSQPSIPAQQTEIAQTQQSTTDRIMGFLGLSAKKLTKSKLGDLRVDEIKKIAADRGIEGCESMTRAQLTEALLK